MLGLPLFVQFYCIVCAFDFLRDCGPERQKVNANPAFGPPVRQGKSLKICCPSSVATAATGDPGSGFGTSNGRNQAVRIPREFELPGEDAIMQKDGDRLIIEPIAPKSLLALLATLAPLDEEFPPIPDAAPDTVAL